MAPWTVGDWPLYRYGLALSVGILLAFLLSGWTFKKKQLPKEALSTFAVLALPLGVICSHVGYCLARWGWFIEQGIGFLVDFREGYTVIGALVGIILAVMLTAKLTKVRFHAIADAMAVPVAFLIAVMRMAEGLVQMGYGWDLAGWFDPEMGMSLFPMETYDVFLRFPFAVQDMYEEWYWAVFVIESLMALGMMVALLACKKRRDGAQGVLLVFLYAVLQLLCESMRQDDVLRWGFVRIGQVMSAAVMAAVILIMTLQTKGAVKHKIIAWSGIVWSMLMTLVIEFALEKKIVALEFLPMDVCYLVLGIAVLITILCVLPLWRRSYECTAPTK